MSADFRKLSVGDFPFLLLEGKSSREIKERFLRDSSSSTVIVENSFHEFQRGHMSIYDEPRLGSLKTTITEYNTTKIHNLVLVLRLLKILPLPDS